MTKKIKLLMGALVLSGASGANAIPLQSLINSGQELTVGDKVFGDWFLSFQEDALYGDAINLAGIDVSGVGTGAAGDAYGVSFQFNGQLDVTDERFDEFVPEDPEVPEDPYDFSDLEFGYSVEIIGGQTFSRVEFSGSANVSAEPGDCDPEIDFCARASTGAAKWIFDDEFFGNQIAGLFIERDSSTGDFFDLADAGAIDGLTKIWVVDDILTFVDINGSASPVSMEQRFVQNAIPEPASVALFGLGLGLLSFGMARRRPVLGY